MAPKLTPRPSGGYMKNVRYVVNYSAHTLNLKGIIIKPRELKNTPSGIPESSLLRRYLRRYELAILTCEKDAKEAYRQYKSNGKRIKRSLAEWHEYLVAAVVEESKPEKEVKEEPKKEAPKKEEPKKEAPKKEEPKKEVQEEPKKEAPKKEVKKAPKKEVKEEPKKEVKEAPKKEVKEEPKKEAVQSTKKRSAKKKK